MNLSIIPLDAALVTLAAFLIVAAAGFIAGRLSK